eukprot:12209879-Ditylum_brightwellii.AAC.1
MQAKQKARKPAATPWKGPARSNLKFVHNLLKQHNNDKANQKTNKATEGNNQTAEAAINNAGLKINNSTNDREGGVGGQQTMSDLLANAAANAAANATGAKTIFMYQTKIEFPVPGGKGTFNLCATFSALMNKLLKMDRDIMNGSTDRRVANG